ncbi:trypsin-like serine protease domain-containing protein masquerade [Choristoneura fumiferana]|uniref:trypsin-like serine protease domain-containing protein masquerade n=1 Tax=Choristoneura fumiferana TaxID=7141 RepID=UPI003D1599BC
MTARLSVLVLLATFSPRLCQDESFASSFLSGLLDTLDTQVDAKNCPGVCMHAIASLICSSVLDEVECPNPSMKCCVDEPLGNDTMSTTRKPFTTRYTTPRDDEDEDDPTTPAPPDKYKDSGNIACPGVCVEARLTQYCEAYLTTRDLCVSTRLCCVSRDGLGDRPPSDLVVPNEKKHTKRPTTALTTTPQPSKYKGPLRKCRGDCISGLFALLCDHVDEDAHCPGEGTCCITEPKGELTTRRPTTTRPTTPALISSTCTSLASVASSTSSLAADVSRVQAAHSSSLQSAQHQLEQFRAELERALQHQDDLERARLEEQFRVYSPTGNDTMSTTRKPFTTRYTTPRDDEDEDDPTTPAPPDKYKDSGNIACPGVCVEARLTQYCEAYLTTRDLCVSTRLCCVSRDGLGDRPPSDLVVPNEKKHTKRPTTALTTTPQPSKYKGPLRKCRGDCISGLFALLCDHVDEDAHCPGEGTCCITEPKGELTTRRPTTTRPTTPAPLPRCKGYCLLNIMAAFCERPAVLLSHTHCQHSGSICCDNSRVPPRTTPRPTTTTSSTTAAPPDPRPDCPGSCIVSLLSFTCFRNAEMTDVFKCKKAGTQCCAPKSKVLEVSGVRERNDTYPLATAPPREHYTQYTTTHAPPMTVPYEPTYGSTLRAPEKYNKYVCGVKGTTSAGSRGGRVMGGEDGERGEWCWQVALINSLNQYLCGAALIGTQWVLTAAHCVTNIVRSGDSIYVRVGDHDLTRKYGSPGAQTLRVATTYIHHNHNSQTLDNDIALLKLHGKAELKEGVCLVCLPARGVSHAAGKRCTVTGYGYMGETGPIPLRVREAELPIVSDAECIRKVNAVTEKIFILPASSFCAGGEEGNDACQGDGGGPLVCQDDGFYELVGLVSWGFGCGRQDVPGVYVKVSSFIGWINQIISVNNL